MHAERNRVACSGESVSVCRRENGTFLGARKMPAKEGGATVDAVAQLRKTSLAKYYDEEDITIRPTGITIKGNLKSFWERAITKAEAKIKIEGNELAYRDDGDSALGVCPWVGSSLDPLPASSSSCSGWTWSSISPAETGRNAALKKLSSRSSSKSGEFRLAARD